MIKKFKDLQKKQGKKGFSMIELIIVIAIMAILVALIGTQLIPYLEKSREKKDLTTLDTCLTNFQAALAEAEMAESAIPTDGYDGIAGLEAVALLGDAYKTFAGTAYNDDTKLNAAFKSEAAKSAGNVQFGVGPAAEGKVGTGVIYVQKGNLVVSSTFSGNISSKAANNNNASDEGH